MPPTRSTEARCARCGRSVETGEFLCAQCREEVGPAASVQPSRPASEQEERRQRWPQAMVRPSPVQYHATIMVTIFLVLLGLGLWAFLNHRGVGPFQATVVREGPYRNGTVTIVVVVGNEGSKESKATCAFTAVDAQDIDIRQDTLLTPRIPPKSSLSFSHTFRDLDTPPSDYRITCT